VGFPFPATDCLEQRLILDAKGITRLASTFMFKSSDTHCKAGIMSGAYRFDTIAIIWFVIFIQINTPKA